MRRSGWNPWVLLVALFLPGIAADTEGAEPVGPETTGRAAALDPEPGTPPRGTVLPDSVLALVGSDRAITVHEFLMARRRSGPSALPDPSTPQEARRFLDLLVDRELLVVAALAQPSPWTPEDSSRFRLARDRLILRAALDSALAGWLTTHPAPGDSAGAEDLEGVIERAGAALRDSSARRLGTVFDEALVERLAAAWRALPRPTADSSLRGQIRMLEALPRVAAADSDAVIARSDLGEYRVGDLLEAWRRLSPAYRPRIETPAEIRELVHNALFERLLRQRAEAQGLDRRPDVALALEGEREEIAVRRYLEREVLAPLGRDSLGPRRHFEADRERWAIPTRVRILSLTLPDRAAAERMALLLRDPVEAESLEARSRRRGIDYVVEATAASDSVYFDAALRAGPGAVIGPAAEGQAWRVGRVLAVLPGRPARFDEARARVEERWQAEEARRRLEELCARLRRATRVTVNERGLARLNDSAGRDP